jgi:hypothetical protein
MMLQGNLVYLVVPELHLHMVDDYPHQCEDGVQSQAETHNEKFHRFYIAAECVDFCGGGVGKGTS